MIMSQIARTIFDGESIASTNYVYNTAGGTAATTGWYDSRYDHSAVQVCVATLNTASLTYRIEGRSDTYERPAVIFSESITSAQLIDKIINVTEHVKEIRVGAKMSTVATPNNIYAGIIFSEVK